MRKHGSEAEARKWAAPPGRSQHEHGNAADLTFNGQRLDKAPESVKAWVRDNAGNFGLALPLDNEPWHVEDATARTKVASGGRSRAEGAQFRGASIAAYVQQAAGLSPFAAAAMGGHAIVENGGRSTGRPGDNGSAFGTFQWRGERLDGLKRFAAQKDADWRDQRTQLDYALWEMDNGDEGARRAGRELRTATTLEDAVKAWMHFERPQGYDPSRPENGHAYARRLQEAKAILSGARGGGGLETAAAPSGGGGYSQPQGAPPAELDSPAVDPRFAAVPFSVRMRLAAQLDSQINQLGVEKRAELDIAGDNAADAIQNTGEYSGRMPAPGEWVEAYGPVDGPRRAASFDAKVATAREIFGMQTQTAEEINATVAAATPTSSGTNAQLQTQRYEALQQAAAQTLKARKDDPTGYAMRAFPSVRQAFAEAGSRPDAFARAIQLSTEAQRSLGITGVAPLPKSIADATVREFENADLPQEQRVARLSGTVFVTRDPEQQRAIFAQLVKAGLDPITEGALEAHARGDTGAARRLMFAALVDPAKLPGKLSATDQQIREGIQSAIMEPGQLGDAIYGLSLGESENADRAIRDNDLLTRAVKLRMGKGEDLSAAVSAAARDLYGDKEVFTASWGLNAKLVVDKGEDTGALRLGLDALMPRIREASQSYAASVLARLQDGAPAASGERAVFGAALPNMASAIAAEGVWRNFGDGYGFFDVYTGSFLKGPDGKALTFSRDEVMKAGRPSPGGQSAPRSIFEPSVDDVLSGGRG